MSIKKQLETAAETSAMLRITISEAGSPVTVKVAAYACGIVQLVFGNRRVRSYQIGLINIVGDKSNESV